MTQKEIKQEVGPSNLEHLLTSSKPLKAVGSGRRGQEPGPGGFIIPGLSLSLSRTGTPTRPVCSALRHLTGAVPCTGTPPQLPQRKLRWAFSFLPRNSLGELKTAQKLPRSSSAGGLPWARSLFPVLPTALGCDHKPCSRLNME